MRLLNISLLVLSAHVCAGRRCFGKNCGVNVGIFPTQPKSKCHNLKTNPNHVPAEKRRLLLGAGKREVVHVKAETTNADGDVVEWSVSRAEMVHALLAAEDGFESFESLTRTGADIAFLDLQRDGMVLTVGEGDEEALVDAFSVTNAFISATPDIHYRVVCPAKGEEAEEACRITMELVECSSEEAAFLAEHVPRECLDEAYDVGLYFSPGPHFFLAGVPREPDASRGCPPSVVMNGLGQKKKHAVPVGRLQHLPQHHMGVALLSDILQAEENAEPIEPSAYDAITNNCVNYARDIWHTLQLAETEELARFIAENIVNNNNAMDYLKGNAKGFFKGKGGVRGRILKKVQALLNMQALLNINEGPEYLPQSGGPE